MYSFKALNKMQGRAAIWILGAFKTSPTDGVEALVGLIPIKSYVQKLGERSQLCAISLPPNHIICSLMDSPFSSHNYQHLSSLSFFTDHQKTKIKGYLADANNRSYGVFSSFSSLHPELSPGLRVIDTFSNCFSFNSNNKGKNDKICLQQLDSMVIKSSSSPSTAITAMDASIKNNVTMSILHTYIPNRPLSRTIHYSAFVTSTEVELFTIRCGTCQLIISQRSLLSLTPFIWPKNLWPFVSSISNPCGSYTRRTLPLLFKKFSQLNRALRMFQLS